MKAPAFMFYTGDFLSSPDVQLMEVHEVGAYCLLLFNSWQSDRPGYLPDVVLPKSWTVYGGYLSQRHEPQTHSSSLHC